MILLCHLPQAQDSMKDIFDDILILDNTTLEAIVEDARNYTPVTFPNGGITGRITSCHLVPGNIFASNLLNSEKVPVRWKSNIIWSSSRIMNKDNRATNGNIRTNPQLHLIHWNAGARLWHNKLITIEALLVEKQPDICIITEANLWVDNLEEEHLIPGYKLVLPNTMDHLLHARIILLVKNNLNVHVMRDHMESDTATIWFKIGDTKKTPTGVKQHHIRHQPE